MVRRFLILFNLFITSACYAGPVFKVVGADGRITYTDKPPASYLARTMSGGGAAAPTNEAGLKSSGKGNADRDPVLASLQVYYKHIIVESAKQICFNLAAESPPVQGAKEALAGAMEARAKWYDRHSSLIEKKSVILNDMRSRAELDQVAEFARRENEPIKRTVEQAPASERLKWCQNMPRTLAAYEFDLARNTVLTKTIMGYEPKR